MSCPALAGPFSCGSLLPSCSLPWVLGWTKIRVKDRAWVFREKVIILELFNAGTEVKKKSRLGGLKAHLLFPGGPQAFPVSPMSPDLPFSQTPLGEARDNDGVERFLCTRDGDAQRSAIALQFHCVADCARAFLLICKWTRSPRVRGWAAALPSLSTLQTPMASSVPQTHLLRLSGVQPGDLEATSGSQPPAQMP